MVYIYILEKDNIPFYVGKTKDPIRRKHRHYQTYGTNIELNIIDTCSKEKESWKSLECYWIEQFNHWGFELLNQNKGGGGAEFYSEETKIKMRGRKLSIKTKQKISNSLKKGNHSKYYTKEIKEKISKGNKTPKPFSKTHIINMGIAKRKNAKPVLQLDLEDNIIKEWESKGLAAQWIKQKTGRTSNITSQIKDCILGKQKTVFNYKWKYKNE